MNIANIKMVLDKIKAEPHLWDQDHWHSFCGTRHCFAGWAQVMSGNLPSEKYARQDAQAFFEMDDNVASYAFWSRTTLEELEELLNPDFKRWKWEDEEWIEH